MDERRARADVFRRRAGRESASKISIDDTGEVEMREGGGLGELGVASSTGSCASA
jgi:hypothetical protein